MTNYYRRRKLNQVLYSRAMMLILLVPIVLMGYAAFTAYGKSVSSGERRESAQAELRDVETRQQALVADLERLESERGIEEALRDRYQVGKEGEEMILLIDERVEEPETAPVPQPPSFWERMFGIVF